MRSELICPDCGSEGSIDWKYDAWARFEIIGVDSGGDLIRSIEFDTQVFDESEIGCSTCGRLFEEQEIVELMRGSNDLIDK